MDASWQDQPDGSELSRVESSGVIESIAQDLQHWGWEAVQRGVTDGGPGSLAALGGGNRQATVTDSLGDPVVVPWRLAGRTAYLELAAAVGLAQIGGASKNDAVAANTLGAGELIATAVEHGADTVVMFAGGLAAIDGGWGALDALPPAARFRGVNLIVACDVMTRFGDAATVMGADKGATPAQIRLLSRRLHRLQQIYLDRYGIDVSEVPGGGAGGGLAGGMYAVGAQIRPGFAVLGDALNLDLMMADADVVITGEPFIDRESSQHRMVGGVIRWAADVGRPVVILTEEVIDPIELDYPFTVIEGPISAAATRARLRDVIASTPR